MFELRSAMAFAALPGSSPLWRQIETLARSLSLLKDIERRYQDFSDLDSRFHQLINWPAHNRFIDGFYDIFTLIFHYHYQWTSATSGNATGWRSGTHRLHRSVARPEPRRRQACLKAHLASAKTALIRSTSQRRPPP